MEYNGLGTGKGEALVNARTARDAARLAALSSPDFAHDRVSGRRTRFQDDPRKHCNAPDAGWNSVWESGRQRRVVSAPKARSRSRKRMM